MAMGYASVDKGTGMELMKSGTNYIQGVAMAIVSGETSAVTYMDSE